MAIQTASTYFDTIASEYDALAQRAMPRYGEMLDEIVRSLPERAERVLELGCGTGALTERLAERYPDAAITAVDGSPEMVAIARQRLDRKPLTTFFISPFEELELPEEGFDLVASNMSLHHIDDKVTFYARLRRAPDRVP